MVKARKGRSRIGRPPVADGDRRDTPLHVLITKGEHEELRQAAADASTSVSAWVRAVALERARQLAAKKVK